MVFSASFVSLLIGMFWVNILEPGIGLKLAKVDMTSASEVVEKHKVFQRKILLSTLFLKVLSKQWLQMKYYKS